MVDQAEVFASTRDAGRSEGMTPETITTTEAARFLKVTIARFRSIAAGAGVRPVARKPGPAGQHLWDAHAIALIHRGRPGQGARTDLGKA